MKKGHIVDKIDPDKYRCPGCDKIFKRLGWELGTIAFQPLDACVSSFYKNIYVTGLKARIIFDCKACCVRCVDETFVKLYEAYKDPEICQDFIEKFTRYGTPLQERRTMHILVYEGET